MQLSQVSAIAVAMAALFVVSTATPAPQPPQAEASLTPQVQVMVGMCRRFVQAMRGVPCSSRVPGCIPEDMMFSECISCFITAAETPLAPQTPQAARVGQLCIPYSQLCMPYSREVLELIPRASVAGIPICTREDSSTVTACLNRALGFPLVDGATSLAADPATASLSPLDLLFAGPANGPATGPLSPEQCQQGLITEMCRRFVDSVRATPCFTEEVSGFQCLTKEESNRQCISCLTSAAQTPQAPQTNQAARVNQLCIPHSLEVLGLIPHATAAGIPICTGEESSIACLQEALKNVKVFSVVTAPQ